MKLTKILIILLLMLSALSATMAMAAKLAPFPDSKTLQPIPDSAEPNISGNVNHKSTNVSNQNINIPTNNSSTSFPVSELPKSSNILFWIFFTLAIVVILITLILVRLRKKK